MSTKVSLCSIRTRVRRAVGALGLAGSKNSASGIEPDRHEQVAGDHDAAVPACRPWPCGAASSMWIAVTK